MYIYIYIYIYIYKYIYYINNIYKYLQCIQYICLIYMYIYISINEIKVVKE